MTSSAATLTTLTPADEGVLAAALADQAVHGGPRRRTWAPIRRGRTAPTVVAWIEVFWAPALGRYVTIPGASRFHDGPERPE